MQSAARRIGFPGIVVCTLFVLNLALAEGAERRPFDVGIDQSNMIWLSKEKQAAVFAGIRKIGVRWFRDAFAYPPNDTASFVEVVRQAKSADLKMLVVLIQSPSDYDNPAAATDNSGLAFDKLCGWPQGSLKLSQINAGKLKARLRGLLDALKAANLKVDAFEIGNEVDWVCFNGDVPFGRTPSPADILTAARGYAKFLQAAAETIRERLPAAKIITFGMAHTDDKWDRPPPHHLPDPAAFVASLRNLDGINYLANARYRVDGFGSHIYTEPDDIRAAVAARLKTDTEALGTQLPIWITEFGYRTDQFPNRAGAGRWQAFEEFFKGLADADARVTFGPVFYYAYDDSTFRLIDEQSNLLPEALVLRRQCGLCTSPPR